MLMYENAPDTVCVPKPREGPSSAAQEPIVISELVMPGSPCACAKAPNTKTSSRRQNVLGRNRSLPPGGVMRVILFRSGIYCTMLLRDCGSEINTVSRQILRLSLNEWREVNIGAGDRD